MRVCAWARDCVVVSWEEWSFCGYQPVQLTVFSGACIITVLQCVYTGSYCSCVVFWTHWYPRKPRSYRKTSGPGVRRAHHVHHGLRRGKHIPDESRPREGFIPAEILVHNSTAGDNGTAGGTVDQPVLDYLVG